MNDEIKVIFVDIDNTIYVHPERYFDMDSINALKKAQEKDIKVFICTARAYHAAEQTNIFNVIKPDGIVTANGGALFINDELIFADKFEKEYLKQFVKVVKKYHLNAEFIEPRSCFLIRRRTKKERIAYKLFIQKLPKHEKYKNQTITKILLSAPKSLDEKLKKELPQPLWYYRFMDELVDITPIETLKGNGVKVALEKLGLSKNSALSIGDDYQDLSMFNETKYSVAMGNGREEVKKAATFVTKLDREHGVAYALKKLGVLEDE